MSINIAQTQRYNFLLLFEQLMVSATYLDVSLVAIKKMSTTICQLYIIPPPNKKLLDKMKNVKGKERTLSDNLM